MAKGLKNRPFSIGVVAFQLSFLDKAALDPRSYSKWRYWDYWEPLCFRIRLTYKSCLIFFRKKNYRCPELYTKNECIQNQGTYLTSIYRWYLIRSDEIVRIKHLSVSCQDQPWYRNWMLPYNDVKSLQRFFSRALGSLGAWRVTTRPPHVGLFNSIYTNSIQFIVVSNNGFTFDESPYWASS